MRIACLQTPAFALSEAAAAARYLLGAVDGALAATLRPDLILLPEVAYPAYYLSGTETPAALDRRLDGMGAPTMEAFAAMLGERAAAAGVYIAAGLALAGGDGRLQNTLVLWDRSGHELLRVGKQFLWHFDCRWFAAGARPPVVAIDGVPTGLFICCDGRAPEIPRRLAAAGAQLLLDATNWVTAGRDPANLPNAQPDYMMRVRALENGVWFAAANKVGREADSIVYCGKSCIIGPDGAVLAMASSDRPETLVADLPVGPEGLVGAGTGGLTARRAGEYGRMAVPGGAAAPAGGAPAGDRVGATGGTVPAPGQAPAPYVALVQVADEDADLRRLLADMAVHGADLAVLPEEDRPFSYWQELSAGLDVTLVAVGLEGRRRTAWLLRRGELIGRYAKGHLSPADVAAGLEPGPAEPPVFETAVGRLGVMIGEDGLVPEVARGLALAGADIIAWPHRFAESWVEPFVRTRAAESRVFVAAVGRAGVGPGGPASAAGSRAVPAGSEGGAGVHAAPAGESLLADPGGVVLTRTFPGARQAVAAYCYTCLARHKEIVPGTSALGLPPFPELA